METFEGNRTVNNGSRDLNVDDLIWYYLPTVITVPLAIPPNALVLRLLLGKPGICSTSEIFILNMALFDTLFCVMSFVEYFLFLRDRTMPTASFLAWGLNQSGGPMLLCLLGLDSYVAVCHPLVFLRLKDPRLRLSLCFAVSSLTAVCCGIGKVASKDKMSMLIVLLSCADVTISTCNIVILKSLRQSGPGRKEVHPVKKRAFKTVLTMLVLVNVHYLPPLFEELLKEFVPGHFSPFSFLTCVTYTALSMSSLVQPLCYLVRTKQLPEVRCGRGASAKTKTVATV